jgi:hypothetical protein
LCGAACDEAARKKRTGKIRKPFTEIAATYKIFEASP